MQAAPRAALSNNPDTETLETLTVCEEGLRNITLALEHRFGSNRAWPITKLIVAAWEMLRRLQRRETRPTAVPYGFPEPGREPFNASPEDIERAAEWRG